MQHKKRTIFNKLKKLIRYAAYLNKKITMADTHGKKDLRDMFADELSELLAKNPTLGKKYPSLEETVRTVDKKIIDSSDKKSLKNLGI